MKVLVTGAAGFIGSHTAAALLKQNYQVVGLDNLNHFYAPVWKKENLQRLESNPAFEFIKADITQPEEIEMN